MPTARDVPTPVDLAPRGLTSSCAFFRVATPRLGSRPTSRPRAAVRPQARAVLETQTVTRPRSRVAASRVSAVWRSSLVSLLFLPHTMLLELASHTEIPRGVTHTWRRARRPAAPEALACGLTRCTGRDVRPRPQDADPLRGKRPAAARHGRRGARSADVGTSTSVGTQRRRGKDAGVTRSQRHGNAGRAVHRSARRLLDTRALAALSAVRQVAADRAQRAALIEAARDGRDMDPHRSCDGCPQRQTAGAARGPCRRHCPPAWTRQRSRSGCRARPRHPGGKSAGEPDALPKSTSRPLRGPANERAAPAPSRPRRLPPQKPGPPRRSPAPSSPRALPARPGTDHAETRAWRRPCRRPAADVADLARGAQPPGWEPVDLSGLALRSREPQGHPAGNARTRDAPRVGLLRARSASRNTRRECLALNAAAPLAALNVHQLRTSRQHAPGSLPLRTPLGFRRTKVDLARKA